MKTDESQWRLTSPDQLALSNEVHVWRAFLDLPEFAIENLRDTLSDDELTKAGRFHFQRDKKRFIASRGILRNILARYLNKSAHTIHFQYTSEGKPIHLSGSGDITCCFNLSHSFEMALYGVSRRQNIGIDIERIRDDVAIDHIAEKFFCKDEFRALMNIDENDRSGLFFQYWTRKEALLKATGHCSSFQLGQYDVSSVNGQVLSPVMMPGVNGEDSNWFVQDLFPREGYFAAIALESADSDISYWHYSV